MCLASHINRLAYVVALVYNDFLAVTTGWCTLPEEDTLASIDLMIPL